jgi:uncharacterized protein (DUF1684 family)
VQHDIQQVETEVQENKAFVWPRITEKLKNGFQLNAKLRKFVLFMRKTAVIGIMVLLLLACSPVETDKNLTEKPASEDSLYVRTILQSREMKDNAFAGTATSPFAGLSGDFKGLSYYPVDLSWRITCTLEPSGEKGEVKIPDSKGNVRAYSSAGKLQFSRAKKAYSIPVYYEDLNQSIMFVMFRDSTNGAETYGGGRYLEFRKTDSKNMVLDFNQAYNPYCHYNHQYACPLVPKTHFIPLFVRAGERNYRN